jgi:hypothetical protein
MNYGFHVEAQLEYSDAIRYYLGIDSGVAENFISEIEYGISAIRRNPLTWRIVEGDVRTVSRSSIPLRHLLYVRA